MSDSPDWDTLDGHPVLLTNITEQDGAITADVHILDNAETYNAATLPAEVAEQAAGNAGTNRNNLGVFDGTKLAAASTEVAALARQYTSK